MDNNNNPQAFKQPPSPVAPVQNQPQSQVQQQPQQPAVNQVPAAQPQQQVPQAQPVAPVTQPATSQQVFNAQADAPVPSQSIQQSQAPIAPPPPPKRKGGMLKVILIFVVFMMIAGGAVTAFMLYSNQSDDIQNTDEVAEANESDTDIDQESSESANMDDSSTNIGFDDTIDEIFDNRDEAVSTPQSDLKIMLTAIIGYYEANSTFPDTNNDLDLFDVPVEWTCIGTAPQCYDFNEAGSESGKTLIPSYIFETPINPDGGFKQETGYEILFNIEENSVSLRSATDTTIIETYSFEE